MKVEEMSENGDCYDRLPSEVKYNVAVVLQESVKSLDKYMAELNLCPSCRSFYMLVAVVKDARKQGAQHRDIVRLLGGVFNHVYAEEGIGIVAMTTTE